MSHGTYDFPAIQFDVAVALTNTTPMGAYRGAGRPEATALLERLVDHAALELGIDPIELRERNLLADDVFPFQTLTGNTYDSGAYRLPLRTAAEAIGYDELRADQAARRANGGSTLLGIGVASYVEITAGGGGGEWGAVEVNDDGSATVYAGTSAHGQGHQTAFAMLVSAQTGIPVDRITLVDGDTDRVPQGGGTGGSRSLQLGGSAVHKATEAVVDKAKALAATLLEADVADIVVDVATGTIGVAGVPASAMRWDELAAKAPADDESAFGALGADVVLRPGRSDVPVRRPHRSRRGRRRDRRSPPHPPRGGRRLRHRAQPAARRGTAARRDRVRGRSGAVRGGPLRHRRQPDHVELRRLRRAVGGRAADRSTPDRPRHRSPLNPLGAKGIGEASTIGSTPAVQNAVIDALAHLGVRHIDMPCTPERVWAAMREARAGTLPDPWREPPAVFSRTAVADAPDEADDRRRRRHLTPNPGSVCFRLPVASSEADSSGVWGYLMARALGGLATPAGRLSGADVKKHS